MALSLSGDGEITGFDPVASGFGKVLQVVTGTSTTTASSTSATFADTNLSASITPSSATNKVLVIINQQYGFGGATPSGAIKIVRDSTTVWEPGVSFALSSEGTDERLYFAMSYLDSPASAASVTYKTQFQAASGTIHVQRNDARSEITLIEVSA
jgi:hypothetical protein